jgi:benzoyl-CoA reductase subunit B
MATQAPPVTSNRLKTTGLNNKMVTAYWDDLFTAKDRGQQVCWFEGVAINPLLQAMDISWCHGEAWSALLAAKKEEQASLDAAEERGYMRELCSYARTHLGSGVLTKNNQIPGTPDHEMLAGRAPPPDMIISAYPYCSTGQQWDEMLYRLFGKKVPVFNITLPYIWGNGKSHEYMQGEDFEDAVKFLTRQLRECVTFIEQVTGKPFDWDRLSEVMSYVKKAGELRLDAMHMCNARPAPATFFEWSISIAPVNFLPYGPEVVDYFEKLKAEIGDRVANGIGSVPRERYRLFWDGIMNWGKLGWMAEKFAAYDACMVAGRYTHMGFWQEPQVIDVDDPLEGMARNYLVCPINHSAPYMIDKITDLCDFYEIDGLVMHGARTCRAFSNPQYLIAQQVSKRLGVKVSMIEGDMIDPSFYKDELVNSRVEAMLEAIDAKRGMI